MGFNLHTLRDLYGEPTVMLEDFIAVALGQTDFDQVRTRRRLELWAKDKGLTIDQREMVLMLVAFKKANPEITTKQILRSQWLEYQGGIHRVKQIFHGGLQELIELANQAVAEGL